MSTRRERRSLQEQQRAIKNQKSLTPDAIKFLLIRHGETDWNKAHRLQGQKDPQLNDLGREQAHAAANFLKDETGPIYSSDLKRASETAQIILKARGSQQSEIQKISLDEAFRERYLGILEGLTIQEAKTQQAEAWEAFISEEITSSVPGELQAESEPALEERASQAIDMIAKRHPKKTVILVIHGGILQVLYRHCTGYDYPDKFHNCAINTIWVDGGKWIKGIWGESSHLQNVGTLTDAFGGGTIG